MKHNQKKRALEDITLFKYKFLAFDLFEINGELKEDLNNDVSSSMNELASQGMEIFDSFHENNKLFILMGQEYTPPKLRPATKIKKRTPIKSIRKKSNK